MIAGQQAIRDAYRNTDVASHYIAERFEQPLGALLHARQVRAVGRLLRAHRPATVLEIAPGPARLTRDLAAWLPRGTTLIDASAQMLGVARRRLPDAGRWRLLQADAFALPVAAGIDFVYSFRLIRHFGEPERARLYREVARVLRPGGLFVFDAVNRAVAAPLRAAASSDHYQHYDALLSPDMLRDELAAAGLELVSIDGVQHRYRALYLTQVLVAPRIRWAARALMEAIDRCGGGQPLEWVVTCRRK